MKMNDKTRAEVNELLDIVTYASYVGKHRKEVRRGAVLKDKETGKITILQYDQVMDALNTHFDTGSYEGCLIWRNAEANPLE